MSADSGSSGWIRRVSAVNADSCRWGCHPLDIVQSLLSTRLRTGLRSTISVNQVQSLSSKEDDSAWRRTFFHAEFHSSRRNRGEQNAKAPEDKGKILRWVRS